jgi:hypothetical protein
VPKLTLDFNAKTFDVLTAASTQNKNGISYFEGFIPNLNLSFCSQCKRYTLWLNKKIIYPTPSFAPWPTKDMPRDVRDTFLEARNVVTSSPKAASALLRLCLQNLMIHLGESGKNLEPDISNLIKKGLPKKLRDALQTVRVIGFDAVKPGEINLNDDVDTAVALFNLINQIVKETISQQKIVSRFYTTLPTAKPVRKKKRTRKKTKTRKPKKKEEIVPKPTILYR